MVPILRDALQLAVNGLVCWIRIVVVMEGRSFVLVYRSTRSSRGSGSEACSSPFGLGPGAFDRGCRNIAGNKIESIPAGWLDQATSLQDLLMHNNLITEIPESWLDQNTKLTFL